MSDHKPVRVMHFIHSLKGGGAEQQLSYLLNYSDPAKLAHAVCCFNAEGIEDLPSRWDIFELDRKCKYDFKYREITQLLISWKPDVVHNWLPNLLANSYLPARLYGKAIYIASYRSAVKLNSVYRILQALVYMRCDALVSNVPSGSLFFPFQQFFQHKKGSFIPNGIPFNTISKADPALPDGFRSDPNDFVLLFVGRLSPEKNIPLLLEGLSRLSGEYNGLKLVICGRGRVEDLLKKKTRDLGIDDKVIFLGYQEDVYAIMKACDLLVLPSFREGMSNVLFEALAAGIPAIASRIPTHEYWFGDRLLVPLFAPGSVEEISRCIVQEMNRSNNERKERREEAQLFVSKIDIPGMVDRYTDFYHDLIY